MGHWTIFLGLPGSFPTAVYLWWKCCLDPLYQTCKGISFQEWLATKSIFWNSSHQQVCLNCLRPVFALCFHTEKAKWHPPYTPTHQGPVPLFKQYFFIMCVWMHVCTLVWVYAHVGGVPTEVSRERPIPWSWSCRCELPGYWELTAPPGVSALVCWAISPAPLILFFVAFLLHFAVLIIKSIALHTLGKHSITSFFFSF